jgi:hypothetical protein
MTVDPTTASRRPARSEEAAAARSALLTVTVAVGSMLSLFDLGVSAPPVLFVPTAVLVLALARRADGAAAWSAAAVWAAMLFRAEGVALMAPLMMIVACSALAVGPDRLLGWVGDEWNGRERARSPSGWIEDVPRN